MTGKKPRSHKSSYPRPIWSPNRQCQCTAQAYRWTCSEICQCIRTWWTCQTCNTISSNQDWIKKWWNLWWCNKWSKTHNLKAWTLTIFHRIWSVALWCMIRLVWCRISPIWCITLWCLSMQIFWDSSNICFTIRTLRSKIKILWVRMPRFTTWPKSTWDRKRRYLTFRNRNPTWWLKGLISISELRTTFTWTRWRKGERICLISS